MKAKNTNHLYTIASFGHFPVFVSCGVFGCGKTYSACMGLGLLCKSLRDELGLVGLTFVVAGKTKETVSGTVGSELTNIFGDDYKPTQSKLDGKRKDALLFDQCIVYIGNNTVNSEASWRGISNVVGVYLDEMTLITEEQYNYILGRLRGTFSKLREAIAKLPEGHWLKGFCPGFFYGSCNPDNPKHFVKKMIDDGKCEYLNWTMDDACWDGAEDYYKKLLSQYAPDSIHRRRYLNGEWCGAEGMVYSSFDAKVNVLDNDKYNINYKAFKRLILGIDYGSNHPTAIVLVGVNSSDTYFVLNEWKFNRTAPSEIVQCVKDILDSIKREGVKINAIYVDPSAVAIKDELRLNKVNYSHAANKHEDGIGCINSKFYTRHLYIMNNCKDLIKEIYGYSYKNNNSGRDEVNKVEDDFCDAMRYAVYSDTLAFNTGGIKIGQ